MNFWRKLDELILCDSRERDLFFEYCEDVIRNN